MPSARTPSVSRVLTIAPTPFFGDRGCHVRIYEEVRALRELGIESLIVTYPAGTDLEDVRIRRSRRLPGIHPRALGPSWTRLPLDVTLLAAILGSVRAWKPHVMHAHLHEGALLATLARSLTGLPVVADLQGSLTEELIDHGVLSRDGFATRVTRGFERWLVRRPDVLLVSSSAASAQVAGYVDHGRLVALPDGADLDRFRPLPRDAALAARLGLSGKRVVAFLGVLTPYQGVDLLLDAVPLVVEAVPDVHFLVMGYPNEEHYRERVRERALAPFVTLPGRVPYAEAARWLCLAEVAVSAKQSLTEANGKLLNYMACGLATVATDTLVNRELLGSHGRYVGVGDASALARELIALLGAPAERARLGTALRRRAELEFSWSALGRRLGVVYEQVVSRHRLATRPA